MCILAIIAIWTNCSDIGDLSEVYEIVEVLAAKWKLLSTKLHICESRVETTEKNYPNDVESCLHESLKEWLKWNYNHEKYGKPSWRKLAKAVKKMDGRLFTKIVSEHSKGKEYPILSIITIYYFTSCVEV